jgi:hypothetical protein
MIPLSRLFEQKNQIQIYCDMDGVLTHFDASAKKIGWTGPLPAKKKEDVSALWALVKDNAEKFWGDMPWMPDGKKLWNFIKPYNPILLTSVANSLQSKLGRDGKAGKERWVQRELGPQWYKNNLIVVESHGKTKYANPNSILIDDMSKNVEPFVEAGGQGIIHKNADDTIRQLEKILK